MTVPRDEDEDGGSTGGDDGKNVGTPAVRPPVYEPYLYDLSPTWDAWCFLKAKQVHELKKHHDVGEHSAFHWGNLPIRWARVVGVVVAVDEFYGKRVFTVDDSSGACIECLALPLPARSEARGEGTGTGKTAAAATTTTTAIAAAATAKTAAAAAAAAATSNPGPKKKDPPLPYPEIDVGTTVDAKGRIVTFRDERQLRLVSLRPVRGLAAEMVLWGKRARFHSEVLGGPAWVVPEAEVRRRRRSEAHEAARRERDRTLQRVQARAALGDRAAIRELRRVQEETERRRCEKEKARKEREKEKMRRETRALAARQRVQRERGGQREGDKREGGEANGQRKKPAHGPS